MIKLVNVSKYYNTSDVIALGLRKVNLELNLNEFVAVVGESGSGKTTLLNVISGIDSYEDGEMYVNGKETSYFSIEDMENYRKKYIAFVFQSYNLIDAYTVLQNVEAPLILSGYPKDKIRTRAMEIIRRVGLEDFKHHKATKLSGGQKQRVVIARALAKDCPIIAADEPTGNLDSTSAKEIIKLLHEISQDKLVIVVTHDFSQVKEYATRKIRIFDGEIVEDRKIKKVEAAEFKEVEDKEIKTRFTDLLKISLRNLLSVPKKTLLMIVIFTFFSVFVAMAFGAYYLATNEMSSNSNHFFMNTNANRIVVKKADNSVFTQADLDQLGSFSKVDMVLPYDYILDFSSTVYLNTTEHGTYPFTFAFLPLDLIADKKLNYGVLPQTSQDVVLVADLGKVNDPGNLIGETVGSGDVDYFKGMNLDYKISGIIDISKIITSDKNFESNEVYFLLTDSEWNNIKDDMYRTVALNDFHLSTSYLDGDEEKAINAYISMSDNLIINSDLDPDQVAVSSDTNYASKCMLDSDCYTKATLHAEDNFVSQDIEDINIVFKADLSTDDIEISPELYNQIFYDDVYQVSVLTNTDIDVDGLFNNIQNIKTDAGAVKYDAVYPYDSEDSSDSDAIAMLLVNIGMIILNAVVLVGSTLITYIIFRAIINTKLHDYAIFRTIGANKKTIRQFIYIENLYVVLVAYVIFVSATLILFNTVDINSGILYSLKVFNFSRYVIFFIAEIIMSLIISSRYCNRIFRETVNKTIQADI